MTETVWFNRKSERIGLCIGGLIYIGSFYGNSFYSLFLIGVCDEKNAKRHSWVKLGDL